MNDVSKMSKEELEERVAELIQIREGFSTNEYDGHPSELQEEIDAIYDELDKRG